MLHSMDPGTSGRGQASEPMMRSPTICFVCVLVTQLCVTLCIPMDCSPPGSSVHGILQARILEWVAISFSICYVYVLLKLLGCCPLSAQWV